MWRYFINFICSVALSSGLYSQHGAKYWIQFSDKNSSGYSTSNPEKFLSQRAIERRLKYHIAISTDDLPVSKSYIDSIRNFGVKVMYASKWFNSITIEVFDTTVLKQIRNTSFVLNVQKTADPLSYKKSDERNKFELLAGNSNALTENSYYGYENTTITMLNGQFLHNLGFRGKGIEIAVIDAGFLNAQYFSTLDSEWNESRILGTSNFVDPGKTVYLPELHGAECLSLIGALQPNVMVGTAPDASFWLMVSEDVNSEYPVEEDNWVAAVELADSLGVDVTSTSLGYTTFDDPVFKRTYKNMNGQTARNSIAAAIAVSKGIAVVVAAGNEGDNSWHYIGTPADAKDILTVGSLNAYKQRSLYSSFGPTSDGRVKPDVMAMGENATVQSSATGFETGSGTSFAAPIISGLIACLIQAFPTTKTSDIFEAVKMSSNKYNNPDSSFGYGITDFQKAYLILGKNNSTANQTNLSVFPNPFENYVIINSDTTVNSFITVECFNLVGVKLFTTQKENSRYIVLRQEIQHLSQGFYIFKCNIGTKTWILKAQKQ